MAETPRSFEDDAVLYLLGGLDLAARREFELRLEQSPELRTLLRELEEGTMATALAAPRHEPPAAVWKAIEAATAGTVPQKSVSPPFWLPWLRSGWAAAAIFLLGWLVYALWVHRDRSGANLAGTDPTTNAPMAILPVNPALNEIGHDAAPSPTITIPALGDGSLARTGEIAALRRQVRDLEAQVANLTHVTNLQQTLTSGSSRFTLFRMMPPNAQGNASLTSPPSPAMQRAVLLALARELGWFQPSANKGDQTDDPDSAQGEGLGVDFVDLPGTATNMTQQAQSGTAEPEVPTNALAQAGAASTPFALFSPNSTMLFFEGMVQGSMPMELWSNENGTAVRLWTSSSSQNPTVVTVPSSAGSWGLTVTSGSNVIGQFAPPPQ